MKWAPAVLALFVTVTAHAGGRKLADATADQDARFRSVFEVVNKWIQNGAFPGAVLAVGQHGSLLALKAFGHTEYLQGAPPMAIDEIFDLASLSKVIGTTSVAAYL